MRRPSPSFSAMAGLGLVVATLTAAAVDGYVLLGQGAVCPPGGEITNAAECQTAAGAVRHPISWYGAQSKPAYQPGCLMHWSGSMQSWQTLFNTYPTGPVPSAPPSLIRPLCKFDWTTSTTTTTTTTTPCDEKACPKLQGCLEPVMVEGVCCPVCWASFGDVEVEDAHDLDHEPLSAGGGPGNKQTDGEIQLRGRTIERSGP